ATGFFRLDTTIRGDYVPPPAVVSHLRPRPAIGRRRIQLQEDSMSSALRTVLAISFAILLCSALGAQAASRASADVPANPKHFFWAPGQNPDAAVTDTVTNDLIYHGGNGGPAAIGVETTPAVYLIWWGPDWASGFETADTDGKLFSSKTLQTYLQSFFANVGGS